MKNIKKLRWIILVAGLLIQALVGVLSARAAVTMPDDYTLYLSAPGAGTVAGVAYADEDVLRYSPTLSPQWVMHFDGSAAGLPAAADIDAYDYEYNGTTFTTWHYMSFDKAVVVPGLGTVDDSDIVLYKTSLFGNTWSLFFDGSAHGLTTDGEDIDGLEIGNDYLLMSTTGVFDVPTLNNDTFIGDDEDQLMWSVPEDIFVWRFDGTDMGIPSGNDLINMAYFTPESEHHISLASFMMLSVQKGAKIQGIKVGAFDILIKQSTLNSEEYDYLWDASASGFPKVDAIDVILDFD